VAYVLRSSPDLAHSATATPLSRFHTCPPLHFVCARGSLEPLIVFLKAAEKDSRLIDLNAECEDGMTPLHYAAAKGHVLAVRILTGAKNVEVDRRDRDTGKTPLQFAAWHGHEDVVAHLISLREKVDVNTLDDDENTPLHNACIHGNGRTVHRLLSCPEVDANALATDGKRPLHLAALEHRWDAIRALLQCDRVDVNARDHMGATTLFYVLYASAYARYADLARLVVHRLDVDVNVRCGVTEETALHLAVETKASLEAVLWRADADVHARNATGKTPMHRAAMKCRVEDLQVVLEVLEARGANAEDRDDDGKTVLDLLDERLRQTTADGAERRARK